MSQLGTASIVVALALALYGMVASFMGTRLRYAPMTVSGMRATYMTAAATGVAVLTLVIAFLSNQFNIAYVFEHSSLAMPRIYTWVAFYAGNEGSLLYIAFSLSAMAAGALLLTPRRLGPQLGYANGVLLVILTFFLAVILFMANPFVELATTPAEGRGINPLLTHPGMFIHPPMLMSGLAAIALPFSLSIGGLLSGRIDDDWTDTGRIWAIFAWALLAIGLLLGAWWAYTILGWGGYWAWDPVENAAFMPWLGLTAFIHSIMVQKRRGMFRMWNLALINITFTLSAFGMFINRGGPVPSVHSFGASTLGWVFLTFLGVSVVLPFALFFYRMSVLKSRQTLESTLSREAAFLVNNLLLLAVAFITLWGVVFPLISEFVAGIVITVDEPFFNKVNGPLLLALVFLMGIGPLLPWRHATWPTVRRAVTMPLLITLGITFVLFLLGARKPIALFAYGVSTLVAVSILQEWVRGTVARKRTTGSSMPMAFLELMASNRPRYGGYVVHLAVVMLAFGIIGSSFYDLERDVVIQRGSSATIGDYRIEFVDTSTKQFDDRTERIATVHAYRDGKFVTQLDAWQGIYPSFNMTSNRAAIRSTPREDLYVMFAELTPDGSSAAFRLLVNPLVWWMWVSGPLLVLGTVVALWPARQRAAAFVASPAVPGRPLATGGLS